MMMMMMLMTKFLRFNEITTAATLMGGPKFLKKKKKGGRERIGKLGMKEVKFRGTQRRRYWSRRAVDFFGRYAKSRR